MRTTKTPFLVVAASFAAACFLVTPTSFAADEDASSPTVKDDEASEGADPPAAEPAAVVSDEPATEKAPVAPAPEPSASTIPVVSETTTSDAVEKKYMLGLPLRLHGGLNLRTDLGVHPIRFDAGVQFGPLDMVAVVDPFFPLDGQFSLDVLAAWRFDWGIAPILGWRMNAIGLSGGPQMQQNLVLGVGFDLPRFFDGMLQGQLGLEMAAVIVKHGGDLPTEVISFASARNYLDLLNFGMFARFEFSVTL
ncbi:MAG: hypothetical protein GY822_31205 [Deltaproteobacteria bacterium]|nr:hypothetical protein [Deltaproteobacteria bacterium]